MQTLVHLIVLLTSIGIVWFFAGVLIGAVERIAKRFCKTGFITAFFVLGALTSISELSVAVNSGIAGVPGVSVGNLVGASVVLLLFVVPLLVVAGKPVGTNAAVTRQSLLLILIAVALPVLLVIDGSVTWTEGLLALLAYAVVAFSLYRTRDSIRACEVREERTWDSFRRFLADIGKVVFGAIAIFLAAHFLVEQAVYFATLMSVPASLVGLVLLSIGTNVPEIVIAIRSIASGKSDIALGDYLGSATMNTAIFGALALFSGTFAVEASGFLITAALFVGGLILMYIFVRTHDRLSRVEGAVLLCFYIAFIALQAYNLSRFAGG